MSPRSAIILAGALLIFGQSAAAADSEVYTREIRESFRRLIGNHNFIPDSTFCKRSLSQCKDVYRKIIKGDFAFISPTERSDNLQDLPVFNEILKKCSNFDFLHDEIQFIPVTAARGFALYRVPKTHWEKAGQDIFIFRAEDYLASNGHRRVDGVFITFDRKACKILSQSSFEKSREAATVAEGAYVSASLSAPILLNGSVYILSIVQYSSTANDETLFSLSLSDVKVSPNHASGVYNYTSRN